ncbi:MAG: hypothetical protein H7Z38_08085 [Rubrivivax sp.]|nr:hypothetical protein [Pyrinomonadaceae bacterium]
MDFHLTSYRESHDGADKVWITVDGRHVFSCKHYPRERAEAEAFSVGLRGGQIKEALKDIEVHGPGDFGDAMRAYLNMPVREALQSSDSLIKAFALIDRRVGERTIKSLEIADSDHTLVKVFYRLRHDII